MRPLLASIPALMLALAAGACTDDPTEPTATPKLELRMTATIPAGAEVEYCKFVSVPETWVTRDAVDFTRAATTC